MRVVGVDFTSAPKRDKPVVVAECDLQGDRLALGAFRSFCDWPAYEQWLRTDDTWMGGFDFPFGLPRRFVEAQDLGENWPSVVDHCVLWGKEKFSGAAMKAFQAARTPRDKHRETDLAAKSESPLKTLANPPVGKMFYEGAWRLLAAGIHIPRLNETGSAKIAVEAYPGLAVSRMGERYYKNDKPHSASANAAARKRILGLLESKEENQFGMRLYVTSPRLRRQMDDASGDWLDAALCAMQAASAWERRDAGYGLPQSVDPVEGWIVSA